MRVIDGCESRFLFRLGSILLLVGFLAAPGVSADPAVWEDDFGTVLTTVSDGDDAEESITLSFDFPFDGTNYDDVTVGCNGGITLASSAQIAYDTWEDDDFEDDFTDLGQPVMMVFNTDLNPGDGGTIYFNDFGDRAVFTYELIATYASEFVLITFQVTLHDDGTIVYGYNGLFADPLSSLDNGIVVGISDGDGNTPPAGVDYTDDAPLSGGTTIYQVWCHQSSDNPDCWETGQDNGEFDLDQCNITYSPDNGGFDVTVRCGSSILMSPTRATVVRTSTGVEILYPQNAYTLILDEFGALDEVVTALDGAALRLPNLDCVAERRSGVLRFSTAADQFIFTPEGPMIIRRQNVYEYDTAGGGAPKLVFDGGAIGVDVDACD
ncbi:MAG: hypothetical protein GY716_09190 [bacterium]|nr:hypothetical protein [bacterium]